MIEGENLLVDDFMDVLGRFEGNSLSHIAFVNDNVGMELGFDLFLADFLLENNWVDRVSFYLTPIHSSCQMPCPKIYMKR